MTARTHKGSTRQSTTPPTSDSTAGTTRNRQQTVERPAPETRHRKRRGRLAGPQEMAMLKHRMGVGEH